MKDKSIFIDNREFQEKVIDCIVSNKIDRYFNNSVFAELTDNQIYKQAMIYGMVTASMMTSMCEQIVKTEKPIGHWVLLDNCPNCGVYCSVCGEKVYNADYANQKLKSKFCPNCGSKMEDK